MKKSVAIEIISYALILLFVYTALSKLFLFHVYLGDLKRSPYINAYALPLSVILPTVELLISFLLFFPRTNLLGLYGSSLLMAAFTFYVWYMLRHETSLPCTCGGLIRELSWPQHLIFNIIFTCLSIIGVWLETSKRKGSSNQMQISL